MIELFWRLLDSIEAFFEAIWFRPFGKYTRYLLLVPGVLVVGILLVSVFFLLDSSFHLVDRSTFRLSTEFSIQNYTSVFSRPLFSVVFQRSVISAVIVTLVVLLLAFPYAYVMVRTPSSFVRKILLFSLFLPFFLGQVVRAYGWLILLGQEGMANAVFNVLGLGPFKLIYNLPAVIFGLIQYMLPFGVLMIAPAIVSIGEELEKASESLGASWISTFRHVVLPLARPGIVAAAAVVFTITLTDLAMPAIMGGGTSDFIANLIHATFFNMSDAGLGSALSVLLILTGSLIFALFLLVLGRGNATSTATVQ